LSAKALGVPGYFHPRLSALGANSNTREIDSAVLLSN
jgi:hypothetical protein